MSPEVQEVPVNEIEHARRCVSVGPAPEWATLHPPDEQWRAPGGVPYSLLLRDEQHHAEENAVFIRHIRRLETLTAVHNASQWKVDFDSTTQRLVLHRITVRRAGAAMEHAEPGRFRFLQREANLEAFIIDGCVSLLVLLEDVRVGDLIETAVTIYNQPRMFAGRCWALAYPDPTISMRAWRWSVRFAPARKMRWKCGLDEFNPTIRELPGGDTEWLWTLENTKAEPAEPDSPSLMFQSRWLQVCDFESWGEVAAGILARWNEDFAHPEVRRVVEQIATEAPTLAARVERAISLVQDDIRYLSLNIKLGGTIPSAPGTVIQRRFGDCKDKSFLLAHVLRWLGVPARPVLVDTDLRGSIGDLLPSPDFNHVVIEYELEGKRRWIDATIPLQGGDAHSRYAPFYALGLPVSPGVQALEEQPRQRKAGHLTIHEQFGIDEAASQARLILTIKGRGGEADCLRRAILMHSPEAFGESRVQFYRQLFPGARLSGKVEWQDLRGVNEIRVALQLILPVAMSDDTDVAAFPYLAHLIRGSLPVLNDKRKTPVQLTPDVRYDHIIEMASGEMSGGVRDLTVRHPAFDFSGHLENSSGVLRMQFTLTVNRDRLRPREIPSFRQRVQEVWVATSVQLLIMRGIKTSLGLRRSSNLLPTKRHAAVTPPPLPGEPLPAEPVMALAPRPEEPPEYLKGTVAPPRPELIAPTADLRSPDFKPAEYPSEEREERRDSSGRRRRRRSSRQDNKALQLGLLIALLLAVVGLMIYFFFLSRN